jgi:ATP-dependent Clp protease ATP-binding subunit ClpB
MNLEVIVIPVSDIGAEYPVNQPEGQGTSAVREQVMAIVADTG